MALRGLMARKHGERWTNIILSWNAPREVGRRVGRPSTRWDDGFVSVAGGDWITAASGEELWAILEDAYVFNIC